jgi:hypothetical protein
MWKSDFIVKNNKINQEAKYDNGLVLRTTVRPGSGIFFYITK